LRYDHQDWNSSIQARRALEADMFGLQADLQPGTQESLGDLKAALSYIFTGTSGTNAINVYERIKQLFVVRYFETDGCLTK
jgi:hypothetical protein